MCYNQISIATRIDDDHSPRIEKDAPGIDG